MPLIAGRTSLFASAYSPCQENPPKSLRIFSDAFPLASGDPGPVVPAANSVSHFQLPSKPFMNASSSLDGVGSVGTAGGGGALGAAARGPDFGTIAGPAAAPDFGA